MGLFDAYSLNNGFSANSGNIIRKRQQQKKQDIIGNSFFGYLYVKDLGKIS
jgi:hypothetical protein